MTNYREMYLKLAVATTDTIEHLEKALANLKQAQLDAEEVFIDGGEPRLTVFKPNDKEPG